MAVLGSGLIFQPVLLECTYNKRERRREGERESFRLIDSLDGEGDWGGGAP